MKKLLSYQQSLAQRSAFWPVKDILTVTQGIRTVDLPIPFQKATH